MTILKIHYKHLNTKSALSIYMTSQKSVLWHNFSYFILYCHTDHYYTKTLSWKASWGYREKSSIIKWTKLSSYLYINKMIPSQRHSPNQVLYTLNKSLSTFLDFKQLVNLHRQSRGIFCLISHMSMPQKDPLISIWAIVCVYVQSVTTIFH